MNFQDGSMEKSSIQYMINHEFIDPELISYWKTSCQLDDESAGCSYFISRYETDLRDLNPYSNLQIIQTFTIIVTIMLLKFRYQMFHKYQR